MPEGIDDRIADRGRRTDAAAFAAALDSEWILGAGVSKNAVRNEGRSDARGIA